MQLKPVTNLQTEVPLRPIDLARHHGLSTQAVRNYEDLGAIPPAVRSETGHRRYTELHALALTAFLALRRGHGYQQAAEIMRAVHRRDHDSAYRIIDATHLSLLTERGTRAAAASTLESLSRTTLSGTTLSGTTLSGTTLSGGSQSLSVGELARRVGVHPATLRTWEVAGILSPERHYGTGYRVYSPDSVRDAEIAQQLRGGGYRLNQVAEFIQSLREAGGPEALRLFLDAWQTRITARSRALLAGAGRLDAYLTELDKHTASSKPVAL